ncbi:Uncharacterized protein PBTT_01061 [Plasmodiophora brassicae]|uniref:Uncharacterized protein n=1 Tax=Plasmodiophora brassicae TaxID=37360 RepID=A0A0G4J076_PLABS|nr:hypothetical protein PBRA_001730 [Plasmodiophora brassicae]
MRKKRTLPNYGQKKPARPTRRSSAPTARPPDAIVDDEKQLDPSGSALTGPNPVRPERPCDPVDELVRSPVNGSADQGGSLPVDEPLPDRASPHVPSAGDVVESNADAIHCPGVRQARLPATPDLVGDDGCRRSVPSDSEIDLDIGETFDVINVAGQPVAVRDPDDDRRRRLARFAMPTIVVVPAAIEPEREDASDATVDSDGEKTVDEEEHDAHAGDDDDDDDDVVVVPVPLDPYVLGACVRDTIATVTPVEWVNSKTLLAASPKRPPRKKRQGKRRQQASDSDSDGAGPKRSRSRRRRV